MRRLQIVKSVLSSAKGLNTKYNGGTDGGLRQAELHAIYNGGTDGGLRQAELYAIYNGGTED